MLKNLEMGKIILDYLGSPKVLIRERMVGQREKCKDATVLALKRRRIQVASRSWKKQESGFFPRTYKLRSADTSMLLQENSFHTSDLQNCKIITLDCFKPLSVW